MRRAKITSLYERGLEEDVGYHRLTFFYGNGQFQLVVDGTGSPIQRPDATSDRPEPFVR